MGDLLKSSCDSCTISKVKCSGGNPCIRCKNKNLNCSYRPKRKRGPQKKQKKNGPGNCSSSSGGNGNMAKTFNKEDFSFISSFEKRLWGTFFSMFKNQNKSKSESPYAWCWYVQQLELLRDHLEKCGNDRALKRLDSWLAALDMNLDAILSSNKRCSFNPSQCGSCSALAMWAPNDSGDSSHVVSNLHVGEDFQLDNCDRARLLMTTSCGTTKIQVNEKFRSMFGLSGKYLTSLVDWSGCGFLPWGGDILGKMLFSESDLTVFLQILAIKFQALGPPKHGPGVVSEREIPSTHIFDLWCLPDGAQPPAREDEEPNTCMIGTFLLRCVHCEKIDNHNMTTEFRLSLEAVGGKRNPGPNQAPPSSSGMGETVVKDEQEILLEQREEQPPAKRKHMKRERSTTTNNHNISQNVAARSSSSSTPAPMVPGDSFMLDPSTFDDLIDKVPEVYQSYTNDWVPFSFDPQPQNGGALPPTPPPTQPRRTLRTAGRHLDHQDAMVMPEIDDGAWLNSLLEYANT